MLLYDSLFIKHRCRGELCQQILFFPSANKKNLNSGQKRASKNAYFAINSGFACITSYTL
jgi:hypothetical protein